VDDVMETKIVDDMDRRLTLHALFILAVFLAGMVTEMWMYRRWSIPPREPEAVQEAQLATVPVVEAAPAPMSEFVDMALFGEVPLSEYDLWVGGVRIQITEFYNPDE